MLVLFVTIIEKPLDYVSSRKINIMQTWLKSMKSEGDPKGLGNLSSPSHLQFIEYICNIYICKGNCYLCVYNRISGLFSDSAAWQITIFMGSCMKIAFWKVMLSKCWCYTGFAGLEEMIICCSNCFRWGICRTFARA